MWSELGTIGEHIVQCVSLHVRWAEILISKQIWWGWCVCHRHMWQLTSIKISKLVLLLLRLYFHLLLLLSMRLGLSCSAETDEWCMANINNYHLFVLPKIKYKQLTTNTSEMQEIIHTHRTLHNTRICAVDKQTATLRAFLMCSSEHIRPRWRPKQPIIYINNLYTHTSCVFINNP